MTATVPDVDSLELLDFEPACHIPNCQVGQPPATHLGIVVCGCSWLMCSECVRQLLRHRKKTITGRPCLGCGFRFKVGTTIGDAFRIEPLP